MHPRFLTPPVGLDRSRPRTVRFSPGGRALVAVIALMAGAAPVVGVLLGREAMRQRQEQQLIHGSATISDGLITRLWRPSKDSKQPKVAYTFTDAGGRVRADEAKLTPARWATLRVGDTLPIRFVEANPALNTPDGNRSRVMPLFVPYLAAALCACGLFLVFPLRREWHLLAEGRAAPALVTGHAKQKTQHGGEQHSMRYEFTLLSGAIARGKSAVAVSGKKGTAKAAPPPIGSVVWVLYDPERPGRNRPYPLALVRLGDPANT